MSRYLLLLTLLLSPWVMALDDPMRPPGKPPQTKPGTVSAASAGFHLSSTFISELRRVAVINGKRLEVGGRIGGAQVVAILPASVEIKQAGRQQTLRLIPLTVKRPSKAARP